MMRRWVCLILGLSVVVSATTLQEAITQGMNRNQMIASKEKAIATSQSRTNEIQSLNGFNLSANADAGYAKSNTTYQKFADANQKFVSYGTGITASKSLFNMRNIRLLDRSQIDTARTELEYKKAKEELVLKIVEQYLNTLLKRETLLTTEAKLLYTTKRVQEYQKKFDEGIATLPDLLDAQTALYMVKSDRVQLENDYNSTLQMLRATIGDETASVESVDSEASGIDNELKPLDVYLKNSSEGFVGHLYEALIAQGYRKDRETISAERYPQVDLQLNGTTTTATDGYFGKTETERLYAGVSVRWNMYNGGQREDKEKTALLQMEESALRLEQQKRDISSMVQRYYNDIQSQKSALVTYQKAIQAAQEYQKALERGYELGVRKITDLLEAKNRVENAKLQYQKGRLQMVSAGYSLRYYGAEYSSAIQD